jgi:hypothetical protein
LPFKIKLEQILKYYGINAKKFGESLGYGNNPAKLYRLLNDENNSPSIQILQDILKKYPDINAKWLLFDDFDNMLIEEERAQYGYCRECIKKDGIIEFLKKECGEKDRRIRELTKNQPDGNQGNEPKKKAV